MATLMHACAYLDQRARLHQAIVERVRKAAQQCAPKASMDVRTALRIRDDEIERALQIAEKVLAQP